ncbi:iron-siderophore ABC transporter substrate-binding protein [Serinibacter salmoneus]|uniref:Iron complex transport system substrate-binding protein n=1 Tax=Serinibacter salmoneus TaxID=556530 RepID=A0A2A9D1F8_9MICO|nr:iron-siderophore ABC transporter substrate-binding protein [Serinibacter salmoneus]PFG20221.1 iron complex transport system substrate-binding protein [Serinibacter salmoneus]
MTLSRPVAAATALFATLALAACSSSTDTAEETEAATSGGAESATDFEGDGAASGSFPVTIEHAYGETVIESAPERVASVAWGNHEAALALGVVPVGMASASWGDDDGDGVLPWVAETLQELGAETPVLFDETEGIDFEGVADTNPDLILAAYSGLTQEDYDTLSQIAPVVAFPETAWATTWQETLLVNGAALGLQAEAEELVTQLEAEQAELVSGYPSLAGQRTIFSYYDPTNLSTLGFYTLLDPRAAYLTEIGLSPAPVVETASEGSTEFWAAYTTEEIEQYEDVQVIVTYGDDTTIGAWQGDPLISRIPAVADGAVAVLTDNTPIAAAANPSPLSIGSTWGNDYIALVAEAAEQAS